MKKISELEFTPISPNDEVISEEDLNELLQQLDNWEVVDYGGSNSLYKSFRVDNFIDAQKLACVTGDLAEQFNHHPILSYTWGKLEVYWFTHSMKGVHWNDLLLADNTDKAAVESNLLQK